MLCVGGPVSPARPWQQRGHAQQASKSGITKNIRHVPEILRTLQLSLSQGIASLPLSTNEGHIPALEIFFEGDGK